MNDPYSFLHLYINIQNRKNLYLFSYRYVFIFSFPYYFSLGSLSFFYCSDIFSIYFPTSLTKSYSLRFDSILFDLILSLSDRSFSIQNSLFVFSWSLALSRSLSLWSPLFFSFPFLSFPFLSFPFPLTLLLLFL